MNGSNVENLGKKDKGDGGADLVVSDKLADGGVEELASKQNTGKIK